ncbi:hypothetical protein [Roseimicrobium sp. ORNL1]|uniref:hypothetical protein n=1 Tax=Roseimicrobium sp. ORNL1 TaxID=2711231 RepID=UPI0013E0F4CA|nr:hypothetical protein [Roseimicrobium sp. ORNL1]QIF01792.1 hypothetical protein G5S37_09725 [Roseimicrobium sp. ORNL1]
MKRTTVLTFCFGSLLSSCGYHTPPAKPVEMEYPWQAVAKGVSSLVDEHAERTAFDRFAESSVPPKRLHTFSEVERIAKERGLTLSEAERMQKRQWFESAATVWHYNFEGQYSGILFCDASGKVRHALLFG